MHSQSGAKHLRRRDYFLVPCIALVTILAMFVVAEISARAAWPADDDDTCRVKDQLGMPHAKPDCTTKTKIAEGHWVTYHFNECGYRTDDSCGQKPPGALRIVLIGSSITEGTNVSLDETFGARTAKAVAQATGRPVQVENLAYEGISPLQCYRNLNQAIALQPDLVVFSVSPFDLEEKADPVQLAARNDPTIKFSQPEVTFEVSPIKKLQVLMMNGSRALLFMQHLLFSNTDTYLRLSLSRGDKTDYLVAPLSPRWQARFSDFQLIVDDMAARLRQSGIPLLIIAIPSHQEAALLTTTHPPPHSDAFEFGRAIQEIATQSGAGYVDAITEFSRVPHSDRLFYLVESHMNGAGNAVMARALLRKCLDGSVPEFKRNVQ